MRVLKFGGSSVANAEKIKHVVSLINVRFEEGEKLAIIFSAFGGVTNLLIDMCRLAERAKNEYIQLFEEFKKTHTSVAESLLEERAFQEFLPVLQKNHQTLKQLLEGIFLVREASPRTLDYVLSFGERNSCFIISRYLHEMGLPSIYVDARNIIKTDKTFGAAKVNFDKTNQAIINWFNQYPDKVSVITGFIAADVGGLTTTLGRGGSDFTAAIVASALNAHMLEIWTDVDGVLTCDPRKVLNAYTIKELSYNEAMELSHFGAKVIYPPTIQPALSKSIPIYIKNTFNPSFEGTLISNKISPDGRSKIKGISSMSGISLITIQGTGMLGVPGTAARIFSSLAREEINIIMITQGSSEHSICFAIESRKMKQAVGAINSELSHEIQNQFIDPITIEEGMCLIAVVGEKMKNLPGVAGRLFQALGRNGVNVNAIAQGSSELNISFAIDEKNEIKALNLIHDSFFLSEQKTVNVFIIGTGLIGRALLRQISEQHAKLIENRHLDIKIVGLANSKKMHFDSTGIDLDKWERLLQTSSESSNIKDFVSQMTGMNLPSSIFVDNTADKLIPKHYLEILTSNISISTPNKIAASSSLKEFNALKHTALARNVHFLYETNVGAGLPIISTLHNLLESGDKVIKIEAVLSGSLSFIFNHFKPGVSFRSIVEDAMKRGLTEPDPREDLSGRDIKRKILILSRDAGYSLEPKDVEIKNILPESCLHPESIEGFLGSLDVQNEYFDKLVVEAAKEKAVLRFMAILEDGKASVKLKRVKADHPFYQLHESDNMIAFTTERYRSRPLIVRGPGAGAEVTAAGIFSEIITIGSSHYFGYN